MSNTNLSAEPNSHQAIITREFDAPRELVYRCYSEPELLKQWLGPRKYRMTVPQWEFRDGGRYRYVHADDDGNVYGFRGVFHGTPSVEDGILQTWEFEGVPGHVSLQKATFEERNGRTVVTADAVWQTVADRDATIDSGMMEGVEDGYSRLDDLLEQLQATPVPAGR
jgi:uncharacterized protein YndB with AHSA1/START domain